MTAFLADGDLLHGGFHAAMMEDGCLPIRCSPTSSRGSRVPEGSAHSDDVVRCRSQRRELKANHTKWINYYKLVLLRGWQMLHFVQH